MNAPSILYRLEHREKRIGPHQTGALRDYCDTRYSCLPAVHCARHSHHGGLYCAFECIEALWCYYGEWLAELDSAFAVVAYRPHGEAYRVVPREFHRWKHWPPDEHAGQWVFCRDQADQLAEVRPLLALDLPFTLGALNQ